jgi:hypothetical protein
VPGKEFAGTHLQETLWWSFSRTAKKKIKQGRGWKRKTEL